MLAKIHHTFKRLSMAVPDNKEEGTLGNKTKVGEEVPYGILRIKAPFTLIML